MSCEIKNNSAVRNLQEVQEYFGLSDKNWLNAVHISQLYDTLVFGHGSKMVILHCKFEKEFQQKVYSIYTKMTLNENHLITSLLCYPISGGSNYIDWTCIMVGLSSGSVVFYTDQAHLLYDQIFHIEPIYSIKAHSSEELYVSYPTCIIVIQTLHLIPILKSLKDSRNRSTFLVEESSVLFKKWEYKSRDINIADSIIIGQQKTCLFDHLLNESLEGFNKKHRNMPPQNALVVTTGSRPYISFHSAREGFKNNMFTDVAKAVTSKLISKLPSWLGGSQPTTSSDKTPNNEVVSELMYPKHELIDFQRVGNNIWMSPPSYHLAVVADNLGRIVLLDLNKGATIRMWKGYRDAQCGFIEVLESKNKKEMKVENRRAGLFLVIYAPKKELIEIWSLQRGPKVGQFHSSKNGFLIYNLHNEVSSVKPKHLKTSCYFFDANDNIIKEFLIPFHCTLSESSSKKAEDFHFLKKLKMCLKNVNFKDNMSCDDILEVCRKIQTYEIKSKALELMTSSRNIEPTLIKSAIELFLEQLEENEHEEIAEKNHKHLLYVHCKNYEKILTAYIYANDFECEKEVFDEKESIPKNEQKEEEEEEEKCENSDKNEKMDIDEETGNDMEISCEEKSNDSIMEKPSKETFELSEHEITTIKKILGLACTHKINHEKNNARNVTFEEKEECLVPFLASFNVFNAHLCINEDSLNAYETIGTTLFQNFWNGKKSIKQLLELLKICEISSEEIMKAFLHFWLQYELNFENNENILYDMSKFKSILRVIMEYAGEKIVYAYNSICEFWQAVREYLLEAENSMNALLAAIICKNQALLNQSQNDEAESFEQVTQEEAQWSLLIGKLDDIAVLTIFICSGTLINAENSTLQIKYDIPKVTLKNIINGGKGIISELVANWIIGTEIDVNLLFVAESQTIKDDLSESDKNILQKLCILKQHFPFSLDSSVLLCYITWNLMCQWSKNLPNFVYLKHGMKYLSMIPESAAHLKHGLCCLLWNAHFKIPLKATKKLVNKTGRLPKEKLCLQDIGISDTLVPEFLETTVFFMELFMNSINYTRNQIKFEDILQDRQVSLLELIVQQNKANLELMKLHYEMFLALELIAFFNIKYPKPIQSLFDEVANEVFFMEINKGLPYTLTKADEIRQNTRIMFLCKAINGSIDLIYDDLQSIYLKDHLMWMDKIKKLAKIWELNHESLTKQQVIMLYVHGYDTFAGELLERICQKEKLAPILLEIAGQRLSLHLKENRSFWSQVATSGTLLTNYLESLSKKQEDPIIQKVKPVSIEQLALLSKKAYLVLSTSKSENTKLRVAGQLVDVCAMIKDISNSKFN